MATLRTPTERTCERCGRRERWDESVAGWRVVREDGEPAVGRLFCFHEWDINGTFVPIEEEVDGNALADG
jgi:hypothetical protein